MKKFLKNYAFIIFMLIGIVVSLAFKPIFVSRYLLPGFSCLWLGIVITYQLKNNDVLRYIAVLLVLVTTTLGVAAFLQNERYSLQGAAQLYEELEKYIDNCFHDVQIVGIFHDGQSVLTFLKKHEVDILFTDICMPFMNGLELIEKLHQGGWW